MTDAPKTPPNAALAILFCTILLILLALIRIPLNVYDEGFAVFNAVRVMEGEVPYRDFWAIYPPGQLYLLAGVYRSFGISLLASRIYDVLVRFIFVIGFFLVARKITDPWPAYLSALAGGLVMASVGFFSYAVYPALAWGIFALWSTLKFAETGRFHWLVLSGVLAGISSFFRWDIGLCGIIGLTAAVFLRQIILDWQSRPSFLQSLWSGVQIAARLLMPAGAAGLILYGLVSLNSGLGHVWDQVVWFPATGLHDVRWLAYPRLLPALSKVSDGWDYYSPWMEWLRFYLPLAVYAVAILTLGYTLLVRRLELDAQRFGILAAMLFGLLAFAQALSRYDHMHALATGVFAFLVVIGLATQALRERAWKLLRMALIVLLPGVIAVYFTSTIDSFYHNMDNWSPTSCYSTFPRASCAYVGENRQLAVDYVQAHTQRDDAIFVGNQRHDMVFVNDVGFYYLAGRPSATRYSELHPGVATTRPVQEEIIRELDSQQVQLLVLVDIWLSQEPNGSAESSGVTELDDYIRSHYRRQVQFGEFQIWQRIDR